MTVHQVLDGDVLDRLDEIPAESVHCVVTSPPYWAVRDYGIPPSTWPEVEFRPTSDAAPVVIPAGDCCLGLEPSPAAYLAHLIHVLRRLRRVLRPDGTVWINLGDTYTNHLNRSEGLREKNLLMLPHRFALAAQADGWIVRNDAVWHKPNVQPESVRDRLVRDHEYIFLLAPQRFYFFDDVAIMGDVSPNTKSRGSGQTRKAGRPGEVKNNPSWSRSVVDVVSKVRKRTVWRIPTVPNPAAHFATFPPDLVRPIIHAATSEHGACIQCGAPWHRQVDRQRLREGQPVHRAWTDFEDRLERGRSSVKDDGGHGKYGTEVQTLGWEPSCRCEADVEPCTVLDPFAGTGVAAEVALVEGRQAISIEKSPESVRDLKARTAKIEAVREGTLPPAPVFSVEGDLFPEGV